MFLSGEKKDVAMQRKHLVPRAEKHFWPSYVKGGGKESARESQSLESLRQAHRDKCDQTQGCCRQPYGRRCRQS